ncbi:MAG: class I SAM-dependent methyltransferase [Candidatus Gracilibacteria bacterium]|nr:class I SAM-dependent methyltransferase [Candidatus Gracilibacteria bacterium]
MHESEIEAIRIGLPPINQEQKELRKRIEHNISVVLSEEYDSFILERRRDDFAKICRDFLRGFLDSSKNYRALEVGAGTGVITKRLNEIENLDVFALDMKADFLEFARSNNRFKENQNVVTGDFNDLPFEDNFFDLYTGIAILNQRNDIEKFYSEALRVLKKDGFIFLPWTRVNIDRKEKEKEYIKDLGINIIQESDWYLILSK